MRSCAAFLLLIPALAGAQSAPRDSGTRDAPSLPPIGLPLPPIGLPLPPLGLPLAPGGTPTQSPRTGAERPTPAPRPGGTGRHRDGRGGSGLIVVAPYYWAVAPPAATLAPTAAAPPGTAPETPRAPKGVVWLEVEPHGVGEVYVDDYLVGTAGDVRGQITVDAGPHHIEVRASNYEPMRVDVRVEAGGFVTLRRTLQVASPPTGASSTRDLTSPREASPPILRKTFYFIPSCYLGDVPPTEAHLPAGCDISKAVVVPPQ